MTDVDPQLQRMVAAHRRVRRPDPRLRAEVARAVALATRQPALRRWIGGMAIGGVAAAAAMLLAHVVALGAGSTTRHAPATPDEATYRRQPDERPAAPTVPRSPATTTTTAPPTSPPAIPAMSPPPTVDRPPPPSRPRPASSSPPTPAAAVADDHREIRLLREAEVALSTDPALALARLQTHRREFPDTALALEREALEILATCAAAPTDAARRRRDAFALRHPGSAYAARVRASCR